MIFSKISHEKFCQFVKCLYLCNVFDDEHNLKYDKIEQRLQRAVDTYIYNIEKNERREDFCREGRDKEAR